MISCDGKGAGLSLGFFSEHVENVGSMKTTESEFGPFNVSGSGALLRCSFPPSPFCIRNKILHFVQTHFHLDSLTNQSFPFVCQALLEVKDAVKTHQSLAELTFCLLSKCEWPTQT